MKLIAVAAPPAVAEAVPAAALVVLEGTEGPIVLGDFAGPGRTAAAAAACC